MEAKVEYNIENTNYNKEEEIKKLKNIIKLIGKDNFKGVIIVANPTPEIAKKYGVGISITIFKIAPEEKMLIFNAINTSMKENVFNLFRKAGYSEEELKAAEKIAMLRGMFEKMKGEEE